MKIALSSDPWNSEGGRDNINGSSRFQSDRQISICHGGSSNQNEDSFFYPYNNGNEKNNGGAALESSRFLPKCCRFTYGFGKLTLLIPRYCMK